VPPGKIDGDLSGNARFDVDRRLARAGQRTQRGRQRGLLEAERTDGLFEGRWFAGHCEREQENEAKKNFHGMNRSGFLEDEGRSLARGGIPQERAVIGRDT
jgi:hypothetical protein